MFHPLVLLKAERCHEKLNRLLIFILWTALCQPAAANVNKQLVGRCQYSFASNDGQVG